MTLPDLDPARAPELLFGDIIAYIEKADGLLGARQPVELKGLDVAVDALCKRVRTLSPEISKEYTPELEHLVERLTQLQKHMGELQGEIGGAIASLSTTKKAAHAYHKNKPRA